MKRSCQLCCIVLLMVSTWTAFAQEDLFALVDDTFADDYSVGMRLLEDTAESSSPSSMNSSGEDSKDNSTDSDASNGDSEPVDEYDPMPSNETVQFVPPPISTVPTPEPAVAPTPVVPSESRAGSDHLVPYSIAGGIIILVIAAAAFALIFRRNRESVHKREGDRTLAMSEMFLSNRSRQDSQSVHIMEVDNLPQDIPESRFSHEVRGSSDIYQESNLSSPGPRFSYDSDSYRYSGATSGGNSVPVLFDDPPSASECSSCDAAPIYGSDISDL